MIRLRLALSVGAVIMWLLAYRRIAREKVAQASLLTRQ